MLTDDCIKENLIYSSSDSCVAFEWDVLKKKAKRRRSRSLVNFKRSDRTKHLIFEKTIGEDNFAEKGCFEQRGNSIKKDNDFEGFGDYKPVFLGATGPGKPSICQLPQKRVGFLQLPGEISDDSLDVFIHRSTIIKQRNLLTRSSHPSDKESVVLLYREGQGDRDSRYPLLPSPVNTDPYSRVCNNDIGRGMMEDKISQSTPHFNKLKDDRTELKLKLTQFHNRVPSKPGENCKQRTKLETTSCPTMDENAKGKGRPLGKAESGIKHAGVLISRSSHQAQNQQYHQNPQHQYHQQQHSHIQTFETQLEENVHNVKVPLTPELSLSQMGFNPDAEVAWNKVELPNKSHLHTELDRRIHNFTKADCVVHIGNDEYHCHMLVLQCYSDYFNIHLEREHTFPESEVSSLAFQLIYDWMIFNDPESFQLLTRENILRVFMGAQYLGVKQLEEQCWAFVDSHELFNEDTAFVLYLEARRVQNLPIMQLMIQRVMRFFLTLYNMAIRSSQSHWEILYIANTRSEMEVLLSAVRWLMHDWDERKRVLVDVMNCVRFGLVQPRSLVDIKRNPASPELIEIMNDPSVNQMREDGLSIVHFWHSMDEEEFYHWIGVLGLSEPEQRNWFGPSKVTDQKEYLSYNEFLEYLDVIRKDRITAKTSVSPTTISEAVQTPPCPAPRKSLQGYESQQSLKGSRLETIPVPTISQHVANKRDLLRSGNNQVTAPTQHTDLLPKMHLTFMEKLNKSASVIQKAYRRSKLRRKIPNAGSVSEPFICTLPGCQNGSSYINTAKEGLNFLANCAVSSGDNANSKKANILAECSVSKESLSNKRKNNMDSYLHGRTLYKRNYLVEGSLFHQSQECVLVFGGIDPHTTYGKGRNTGKDMFRYVPEYNAWEFVGELPEPRHHHSVVFLRGRVYLAGGADPRHEGAHGGSVVVGTVWSYDPVTRAWFNEKSMITPRKNFGLVVSKNKMYAIGGMDDGGRLLSSVEMYDPVTSQWSKIAPLRVARMGLACTKYRDRIWIAGGMVYNDAKRKTSKQSNKVTGVVEAYDDSSGQWERMKDLRVPRGFAGLFTMNDKLHLIGGAAPVKASDRPVLESVATIDVWNNSALEWRLENQMSIARHGHSISHLGTQIMIIGGMTTVYMRALSQVECYCCDRGTWLPGVCDLLTKLSGHASLSLPPASIL